MEEALQSQLWQQIRDPPIGQRGPRTVAEVLDLKHVHHTSEANSNSDSTRRHDDGPLLERCLRLRQS